MSDYDDSKEHPDYLELRNRFLKVFSEQGDNIRDAAFINDAVHVFCIEALREKPDTPRSKAAHVIAARLMGLPDEKKEWQVTFPYVWMPKENILSDKEMEQRSIGGKVWKKVKAGTMVTHAAAEVAAEVKRSSQKVLKDYYHWASYYDRLLGPSAPSKNDSREKE